MTTEHEKELANEVRRAVAVLNHALKSADEAGIRVSFDVCGPAPGTTNLDGVGRKSIQNVRCRKDL